MSTDQVLTAEQMRAGEQELFDAGTSVNELMEIAAGGAAEWIRRLAAGRSVTVLCGPGNNGGDGYVIARRLREAGNAVQVIAPLDPATDAAQNARDLWSGPVGTSGGKISGDVFVDCLFGSGLSRPLTGEHALLLRDLASRHGLSVAIDVPSGIDSDTGACLNDRLPVFDVTLALGAWKFAHWTLPGRDLMGTKRLVPIGVREFADSAKVLSKPVITEPATDAHKYSRGLAMIVGGAMTGAGLLAAAAAMRAGAGYVKLASVHPLQPSDPGLVVSDALLPVALRDPRLDALLVGPGLGRDETAKTRLEHSLARRLPTVLDADALMMLKPDMLSDDAAIIATPHDGELESLCRSFSVIADGRRRRAMALARASGMVIIAKGPDTIIAAPDGRCVLAPPATSWLSAAGTGDVLAGICVSRLATGTDPFAAACEAVWLHRDAARLSGAGLTAHDLARNVDAALLGCLGPS